MDAYFDSAIIVKGGHSAINSCRTLDIIHVAAALLIGAREFVTFDGRQEAIAKKNRSQGSTVIPGSRRRPYFRPIIGGVLRPVS
jgi:hypothetical protein